MDILRRPYGLIVLSVGITAVLTIIFGVLYTHRLSENLKAQYAQRAALSTQIFAESILPNAEAHQLQALARVFIHGDVLYAQIVRGGKILADERAELARDLPLPLDTSSSLTKSREGRLPNGAVYLDVLRPLIEGSSAESGYVRVGFSLKEVESASQTEILIAAGMALAVIALVGALGGVYWIIQRRAVLARSAGPTAEVVPGNGAAPLVRAGPLTIDPASKEVRLWENRVELSPKEYELLTLLASEPGRVFSNREILGKIWPEGDGATAKDVKQYIYLLRKKLQETPECPRLIVTVRGFGYKLAPHWQKVP